MPTLASQWIGTFILASVMTQAAVIITPSFAQAPSSSPATAAVSAQLEEELPRTVRAVPDEILGPRVTSGAVSAIDRVPRLVASDPRVVSGDLPSFQFNGQNRTNRNRSARIGTRTGSVGTARGEREAIGLRLPAPKMPATGGFASHLPPRKAAVIAYSATVLRAADPRAADPVVPRAISVPFFEREEVARISPLAIAFAILCGGLIGAWYRSCAKGSGFASVEALDPLVASYIEETAGELSLPNGIDDIQQGVSLTAPVKRPKRVSVSRKLEGAVSSAPAALPKLAPRRLIHALAGLNAELVDRPIFLSDLKVDKKST